jgi:hypothetical protein
MRQQIALLLTILAGFLVVVVGILVWESSTAFWLRLPSWAPIMPLACCVGALSWAICRVVLGVHHRGAGK